MLFRVFHSHQQQLIIVKGISKQIARLYQWLHSLHAYCRLPPMWPCCDDMHDLRWFVNGLY